MIILLTMNGQASCPFFFTIKVTPDPSPGP